MSHEKQENSRFLNQADIQYLNKKYGIKEGDNTIYLEASDEQGELYRYHFPKQRKYDRAGGGEFDLEEDIRATIAELEKKGHKLLKKDQESSKEE